MIKDIMMSDSEILHVNPKDLHGALYEEAWDKVPDSTKMITELGWRQDYDLEQIIDEMYEYYKEIE